MELVCTWTAPALPLYVMLPHEGTLARVALGDGTPAWLALAATMPPLVSTMLFCELFTVTAEACPVASKLPGKATAAKVMARARAPRPWARNLGN